MSHPEKIRFVPLVGIKSLLIVLDFINTISFQCIMYQKKKESGPSDVALWYSACLIYTVP